MNPFSHCGHFGIVREPSDPTVLRLRVNSILPLVNRTPGSALSLKRKSERRMLGQIKKTLLLEVESLSTVT